MTRRELLALSILAPLATAETITYRNNPPYLPYIPLIEKSNDDFPPDPVMPSPPPRRDGRFADVTGTVLQSDQLSKGIPYWIGRLDPATGIDIYGNNGIAVGDIDNDGRDEIYVCQPSGLPNRLYRWRQAQLEDISVASGVDLLDDTSAALFVDLRNLGRQDLIVLSGAGPVLFLNDGQGRFLIAPNAFRFATPPQGGFTGMAAADYDKDGKLDLYLCTYSFFQSEAQFRYPVPYFDARNGPPNFLFRNRLNADGSGFFEDVTTASGLQENNDRYSFAPAWCDYDGSGWPSLYVANDFGRNNLYQNQNGKFRDVAAAAGVEDIGPGMSACWFDENGDGRPDLYVANMWTAVGQQLVRHPKFPYKFDAAWHGHTKGNSLFRNLGNGKFSTAAVGLEMGRWGWSADAADFDNDGRPELFLTCGMMTGPKKPDLMGFFWREVVAKTPATASASGPYESGWNAINQFIREGYSWNGNEPNVFYCKEGTGYRDASAESGLAYAGDARAFAVTDIDGDGCLDLVVKNRLAPQLRVFQNRTGQSRTRIAFRLTGTKSNRDAIGARITVDGQTKWLSAGSGYLSQHTKSMHFGLNQAPTARSIEITWPSGFVQRLADLAAGALYEIVEGQRPVKRPFSTAAAIPAKEAAADNTPRLQDTWLIDPVPLPEPRTGPALFVLTQAEPDLLAAYTLFRRYLFEFRAPLELPLALLLNAQGHAVKVYATVPSADQVKADFVSLAAPPGLPYPGRALGRPRRDYFKLGASLLWCGYPEQALPYLEAVLVQQPGNVRTLVLVAQVHREANRLDRASILLDDALRFDPRSAEAWNELGGVAMARNDYAAALQNFEQALAAKSDVAYVLLNAAQAADKLKRLPEAEAYYRQALTADAKSPEANQGLGLVLAKRGNLPDAERFLREAVRLRPTFAAAWNNLGVLYLQQNFPAKAVSALEQGIAAAPSDEMLYLNLGRVYVQAKEFANAQAVMRRLLKVQPESKVARKALEDLANAQP
ncbi:MAG: FG-GAP-like repeat-containing protein [Acidobacteria bacterium]|nr:FG-GAP-like repeat-containing protein [Acidobacteriota bacterium]